MIDAYVFKRGDVEPMSMSFFSMEELLKFSSERPETSVYLYDDPAHFYRAGEVIEIKTAETV